MRSFPLSRTVPQQFRANVGLVISIAMVAPFVQGHRKPPLLNEQTHLPGPVQELDVAPSRHRSLRFLSCLRARGILVAVGRVRSRAR